MSRCSAVQLRPSKSRSKRACLTYFNATAERITKRQFEPALLTRFCESWMREGAADKTEILLVQVQP
jgi:hypothetical protein